MDVFDLRGRLVGDYAKYVGSFITIADRRIDERVRDELNAGILWPDPLLQPVPPTRRCSTRRPPTLVFAHPPRGAGG